MSRPGVYGNSGLLIFRRLLLCSPSIFHHLKEFSFTVNPKIEGNRECPPFIDKENRIKSYAEFSRLTVQDFPRLRIIRIAIQCSPNSMVYYFREALAFLRLDSPYPTLKEIEFVLHGMGAHGIRDQFFANDTKECGRDMERVLLSPLLSGRVTTRFHLPGVKDNLLHQWILPALRSSFPSLDRDTSPRFELSWDGKSSRSFETIGALRVVMLTFDK